MSDGGDVAARLLQTIWHQIRALDESDVGNIPAARRAIASGAEPSDLVRTMQHASYEMAFGLLFSLAAEHAESGNYEAKRGWTLVEADLLDSGVAVPNGNDSLDFVHESLLSADPTGLEGQDLFT